MSKAGASMSEGRDHPTPKEPASIKILGLDRDGASRPGESAKLVSQLPKMCGPGSNSNPCP